ncbi:MAG: hypothetical protein ACXW07_10085, partial [Nitrososphaeraceae archaeon]
ISSQDQEMLRQKLNSDPKYSFQQAMQLLLAEEDYRKLNKNKSAAETKTDSATKAFHAKTSSDKFCALCEKTNHEIKDCFLNPKNPNNKLNKNNSDKNKTNKGKNKLWCKHCKKDNHSTEKCYSKSKSRTTSESDEGAPVKEKSHFAYTVVEKADKNKTSYVDSGCSIHTCNNNSLITNIKDCEPFKVQVANGQHVLVKQLGEIIVYSGKETEVNNSMLLSNVAYSPEFAANLISLPRLVDQGYKLDFDEKQAKITNVENEKSTYASRGKSGLFELSIVKPSMKVFSAFRDGKGIKNLNLLTLWHERMGHISAQSLAKLRARKCVHGIDKINPKEINNLIRFECTHCALAQAHRVKFSNKSKQPLATKIMERFHCDVAGPITIGENKDQEIESLAGNKYLSIIVDEYSGKIFSQAMRTKGEASSHIINEIIRLETLTNKKLKYLHSDGGGEYNSNFLTDFCTNKGITKTSTTPNTPQHNGRAERAIRTLFDHARAMLAKCKLPLYFWAEAIAAATYLHNRCFVKRDTGRTAEELFTGNKPSINHIKVFGCNAFISNHDKNLSKLENKARKGIMIGYSIIHKVYRIFDITTLEVVTTRDVEFHEDQFSHVEELNLRMMDALNLDNIYNAESDYRNALLYNEFEEEKTINKLLLESINESKQQSSNNNINKNINSN